MMLDKTSNETIFYECVACKTKIAYKPGFLRCTNVLCEGTLLRKHFSCETYFC